MVLKFFNKYIYIAVFYLAHALHFVLFLMVVMEREKLNNKFI